MEAKLMKICAVLLLFSVCSRGNADQCSLSDLAVSQSPQGQEFAVTVENGCSCTQSDIKVSCEGFTSDMGVDVAILRPDGDGKLCTLNDGRAVGMGPDNAVKFSYTASSQIDIQPVSSTVNCS